MNRPQTRTVDGVDRAAFALMCAMTNWAQPNPTEQEQQEHWRGLSPELRGQYRKWAHAVLDAHHCACAHDACPTGLDGIALQHARLLDRLERSRTHGNQGKDVAYWSVLSALRYALIDDRPEGCSPDAATVHLDGDAPRITCPHGEFKSWQAWADHAIHCQRATDNKGKVMV